MRLCYGLLYMYLSIHTYYMPIILQIWRCFNSASCAVTLLMLYMSKGRAGDGRTGRGAKNGEI